ncbi:TetR/AcrR family transcriptional regulator [Nocardioides insulae]|uniref:TetR/AcrR family transcriptional regulator n=1 Tax=Nocardioides insulae TaxID=394734 RepID=UPI000490748D|nr:TetR/AcrR family transcriptional regulator [Nocardioides insulae]
MNPDEAGRPVGRLRPEKREAIMTGAREIFAREGYERASVDAIAAAAGVSNRTLYKHFADKTTLFAAVIAESAAQIAEEETTLIERLLSPVSTAEEVEPALVAFATEWLAGTTQSATHRALIRQVGAEAAHLGADIITAWWQAGPGRVRAELTATLARWADLGLLGIEHPERAAIHFSELVSARPGPPGSPFTQRQRRAWAVDGVAVFVRGYRPQPTTRRR